MLLTAEANSFSRRPVMKTYAPSATKRFAVARPIPLVPPVTSAILRSSLPAIFSSVVILRLFRDVIIAQSHAARLDTVEDGVVPVSVEPCDFGVGVETQNVAVRDVYVLALLCNSRHFGRYGPTHLGLDHHYVSLGRDQLDHFDSKVRNGIRKRAPYTSDATTDWRDALAPVRSISSERAICGESEHAINIVGIVRSEELLGSRYVVFRIRFHLCAPLDRFFWDLCGLVFKPLAERFDLFLRVRREQVFDGDVGRRNENRFGVRESVKPGLAVVVTDAGISDPAKGHGFDE